MSWGEELTRRESVEGERHQHEQADNQLLESSNSDDFPYEPSVDKFDLIKVNQQ